MIRVLADRLPIIEGDVARVPLTRGLFAMIDAADAEMVGRYHWHAQVEPGIQSHYAVTRIGPRRKTVTIYMHRLIVSAECGSEVDHANHDGLDNRRANLRPGSSMDNRRNRLRVPSHNTSGYLGAYRSTSGRWVAQARIEGRGHHIGVFDTARDAALARDAWIRENHPSEFWTYNFPLLPGERGIHDAQGATA